MASRTKQNIKDERKQNNLLIIEKNHKPQLELKEVNLSYGPVRSDVGD